MSSLSLNESFSAPCSFNNLDTVLKLLGSNSPYKKLEKPNEIYHLYQKTQKHQELLLSFSAYPTSFMLIIYYYFFSIAIKETGQIQRRQILAY